MPNTKAAAKYIRKTKTRRQRNVLVLNKVKNLIKQTRFYIAKKQPKKAASYLSLTIKALDKAAEHNYIKKNTSRRKKSRLTLAFNKIKTVKKSPSKTK